jgi:hypothetical protein
VIRLLIIRIDGFSEWAVNPEENHHIPMQLAPDETPLYPCFVSLTQFLEAKRAKTGKREKLKPIFPKGLIR